MHEAKSYEPRNQSRLPAADRLLYEHIRKIVEKSVAPYREKTYGRKG